MDFFDFRLKPRKYQKGMGPRLQFPVPVKVALQTEKKSHMQPSMLERTLTKLSDFWRLQRVHFT